jgi:hypothetical protein
VKLEKIVPRVLRPKDWRRQKFTEVRYDQTRQRFDRIHAHYLAYQKDFASDDPCCENFRKKVDEIKGLFEQCQAPKRPLNPFAFKKWVQYRKDCGEFESKAKAISAAVHELHVLFVKCAPFQLVEAGIDLGLFDLKVISSHELYEKARRGLERYDSGWVPPHASGKSDEPRNPTAEDQDGIRARCIILVQETRRQSLALAQLEVLRDAVTSEIMVAAARLSLMLLILLAGCLFVVIDEKMFPVVIAGLVCAQGGVLGSVISAIIRVGKMQDNLDASRTLALISGASRSIYYVPMIGCLSALILFSFALGKFDLGVIKFDLLGKEESICDLVCCPAELIIRSLILGIISGFSERLVHDLVDRFNKKPTNY